MKKLLIVLFIFTVSCSATENKQNVLTQKDIAGIWNFVASPIGDILQVSTDGTISPPLPITPLPANSRVIISESNDNFIVGDGETDFNIYTRVEQSVGSFNGMSAVYSIQFVRSGTLSISTKSTGLIVPFMRWVKIRRVNNELLVSKNFATPAEASVVESVTIITPLASLVN